MPRHTHRASGLRALALALALAHVPAATPLAQSTPSTASDIREYQFPLCGDATPWAATPEAACAAAAAILPRCDRPGVVHYNITQRMPSVSTCALSWDFTAIETPWLRPWSNSWQLQTRQASQLETPETCDAQLGNPIVAATGEKIQTEPDFATQGADPLVFERTYRSRWGTSPRYAAQPALGPQWIHNHEASVFLVPGTSPQIAHVTRPNGDVSSFSRSAANAAWIPANGRDSLADTAAGRQYQRAGDDTRWLFDTEGRLLSQTRRNGWQSRYTYGADGLLAAVTNTFGQRLQFTWDAQRRLVGVIQPDGGALAFDYDTAGRLTTATYPDATQRRYHYENAGYPRALTGITDETGTRFATWTYDAAGRATGSEHAGGVDAWRFAYPAADAVPGSVTVTDPRGTQRRLAYGASGHQVVLTGADQPLPGSSIAQRVQNAAGLVDSETDFLGIATFYTWDTARRLPLSITRAGGLAEAQTTATRWHTQFALPERVTQAGRTTDTTYDAAGNRLTQTVTDTATGQSRTWSWGYDERGLPATLSNPLGGTWRFTHDAAGNRVSTTDPLGHVTQFTHDAAGRVLTRRDPSGLHTHHTYDARGRVLTLTAAGESTTFTYTPTGQLASATLPSSHQVRYTYDAAQRLVGATDNRGATVRWKLDAMGQRVREEWQDAAGRIARSTGQVIDTLGRVIALQGSGGQTTQLAYDANGEPVGRTDALGQTTRRTLDALRRPTLTTFADNASAAQAWNALDQLTQLTDPKGVRTAYETNAFGEVVAETSPDTGTRRSTRDAAGNLTQMEDAKGQVTRYEHDAAGRPTRLTHADGAQAVLAYDAMGRLTSHEEGSGTTRYERDPLGRITGKTQQVNDNPTNPSRFQVGYQWEGGELAAITYPSGLKLFYRREAGRIVGIDVQRPGKRQTPQPWISAVAWTALGQPQAWRWANGDAAARQFDTDGRMVATEFARYGHDAAGRMTDITQNLWARTTRVNGTTTLSTTALAWQAAYDNRDRLVRFTRPGQDLRYTYDANGNRLSSVREVTSDSDLDGLFEPSDLQEATSRNLRIEGNSNRLLGFTQTLLRTNVGKPGKTAAPVITQAAYLVDANGSLTNDGSREFAYDASGRLSRVVLAQDAEAASVRYLHNLRGQRVFKSEIETQATEPDAATLGERFIAWLRKLFGWLFSRDQANTSIGTGYVYGDTPLPEWALLGEYDNGSATGRGRTEYLWLPTEDGGAIPIGLFRSGKLFAVHPDHLGTPRLVTNEVGEPVWQWPYSAFGDNKPTGVLKATPNPRTALTHLPELLRATTPIEFNLRLPGQYHDTETGLAYNYWRSYCAECGRYVQADPIGMGGGWNRFGYVGGDPLGRLDPFGLDWIWSQSSGALTNTSTPGQMHGSGYAGHDAGVNNPAMQNVQGKGPLPQGAYTIEPQRDNVTGSGTRLPGSMRLIPDPNNRMYGRGGFLIHGDNGRGNRSASEGCIILDRTTRNLIERSDDRTLRVVP